VREEDRCEEEKVIWYGYDMVVVGDRTILLYNTVYYIFFSTNTLLYNNDQKS